jgi:hypothetical protein
MANRYFVDGGGSLAFNVAANWSLTSGGTGGETVPSTTDDVFFDANSPNMTGMVSTRTVLSVNFTGYTNTFTLDFILTINGTNGLTTNSTMSISGSSDIRVTSTTQITSGGFTFNNLAIGRNTGTITINDNIAVSGTLTLGSGTQSPVINGNTITCSGNLFFEGTSGNVSGTTSYVLSGTGSWTSNHTTGGLVSSLTINTSGTITMASGSTYGFRNATLTYIAGTVITDGTTLNFTTTGSTIDTGSIIWHNVNLTNSVTHTISSNLNLRGILTIGGTTSATVINGSQINVSGGLVYNGISGVCSGTTIINLIDNQTITAPNKTSGRIENPIYMDAPGKTIYFDDNASPIMWSNLKVFPGTTLMSSVGTFPTVGLLPPSYIWVE